MRRLLTFLYHRKSRYVWDNFVVCTQITRLCVDVLTCTATKSSTQAQLRIGHASGTDPCAIKPEFTLHYFLYYHKYRTGMFPRFRLSPELQIASRGCSPLRLYSWGLICGLASQPSKSSYPMQAENGAKKRRRWTTSRKEGRNGPLELTWSFV